MSETTIDEEALASVLNSSAGPIAEDLRRRAVAVQQEARRLVHKDTEELEISIGVRVVTVHGILHAEVFSDNEHAFWQEFDPAPQGRSFLRAALGVVVGQRGRITIETKRLSGRRSRRLPRFTAAERGRKLARRQHTLGIVG